MKNKRYVVDTNILISAILIRDSQPNLGLQRMQACGGQLIFSAATYLELSEVLLRPKFDRYVSRDQRLDNLAKLQQVSRLVTPTRHFTLCRDPKDNKFLDAAFASQAEALISGDKDLLVLQQFQGSVIITISQFLTNSQHS